MGPAAIRICRKLRTDTQISLGLIILIILWCEALSVLEKMAVGQFQKFTGTQRACRGSLHHQKLSPRLQNISSQNSAIDVKSDQISWRLDNGNCPTFASTGAHDATDHFWKCSKRGSWGRKPSEFVENCGQLLKFPWG